MHNTDTVPEIEDYNTDDWVARTKSVQRFPTPRGVVDGRIDIEQQGPGFGFTWFRGIVDTLLIGCSTPIDDEHTRVCFNFKTRKLADERATKSVGDAFINEVCKQFEEDRPDLGEQSAHHAPGVGRHRPAVHEVPQVVREVLRRRRVERPHGVGAARTGER